MTIYDENFGQFRPRAPWWRLALVSLCQVVIAAMVANTLVAAYETWIISRSEIRPIPVEITPWSTAFARIAVRSGTQYYKPEEAGSWSFGLPVAPEDAPRAGAAWTIQDEHMAHHGYVVLALVVIALLLVLLSPSSPRFGSRLFVHTFAEVLLVAAFCLAPHEPLYVTGLWYQMPAASMLAGFVAMTIPFWMIWLERRAISVLANVYAMERLRTRLAIWSARIAVPALLLGGVAYFAWRLQAISLAILLGATFLATLARPRERFEQLVDPELGRGFRGLVVAAALIVIASAGFFGIKKTRAVVITARGVTVERWDELDLAKRPRDRQPRGTDRR